MKLLKIKARDKIMDFDKLSNLLKNWGERAIEKSEGRGEVFSFFFDANNLEYRTNIHIHSKTFSDGARSAKHCREMAARDKLDVFALTDHDNIGNEAESENEIKGVEITCRLDPDNEIEILVYNFDYAKAQELINNGPFPYLSRKFKIARNVELARRRLELCNKLNITDGQVNLNNVLGIQLTDENGKPRFATFSELGLDYNNVIKPGKSPAEKIWYNGSVYQVNYDNLIRKTFNLVHNSKNGMEFLKAKAERDANFNPDSFDHFLKQIVSNKKGALYVESHEFWPTAKQVIEFAKQTGGVAMLAHPFGYGKKIDNSPLEIINKAVDLGVDGIEVWHGFNQSDEIEFLYKFCYTHDLLISMGADTHKYISSQGDKTDLGTFPGVGFQSRYADGNVSGDAGTLYNLHYYGTGVYRGEKSFDEDSLSPSFRKAHPDCLSQNQKMF